MHVTLKAGVKLIFPYNDLRLASFSYTRSFTLPARDYQGKRVNPTYSSSNQGNPS